MTDFSSPPSTPVPWPLLLVLAVGIGLAASVMNVTGLGPSRVSTPVIATSVRGTAPSGPRTATRPETGTASEVGPRFRDRSCWNCAADQRHPFFSPSPPAKRSRCPKAAETSLLGREEQILFSIRPAI